MLSKDGAKDQPISEVTSDATGKASQARFLICLKEQLLMNNIVYMVGAVVIVLVILSFLGFR